MKPPPVYDQYSHPADPGTTNTEPSLTQQQYKDECDINVIMKRYSTTGLLPLGTTKTEVYDDFSQAGDYLEAMLILKNAQDQFNELEANVRLRFHNDPAEFLEFVHNPDNLEEARKLGMLTAQAPPPPQPAPTGTVPVTAPPAQPAPVK